MPASAATLARPPDSSGGLHLAQQRQHLRRVRVRPLGERCRAQPVALGQQLVELARRSDLHRRLHRCAARVPPSWASRGSWIGRSGCAGAARDECVARVCETLDLCAELLEAPVDGADNLFDERDPVRSYGARQGRAARLGATALCLSARLCVDNRYRGTGASAPGGARSAAVCWHQVHRRVDWVRARRAAVEPRQGTPFQRRQLYPMWVRAISRARAPDSAHQHAPATSPARRARSRRSRRRPSRARTPRAPPRVGR
jgi:hypothetical protein